MLMGPGRRRAPGGTDSAATPCTRAPAGWPRGPPLRIPAVAAGLSSEQTELADAFAGLPLLLGPLLRLALPQAGLERGLTRFLGRFAGL
ncbi:hypothetical protein M2271_007199 [Streptomyces sp. LBL]|nr:hypothetical protein [Streptomyces sp. LBL]